MAARPGALAKVLGADPSSITRWIGRGMPTNSISAAQDWHAAHVRSRKRLVAVVAPVDGDPKAASWRDRLDRAKALREETQLKRESGELLPRPEVLATWQTRFAQVRAHLLGIPDRVGRRVRPTALRDEVLAQVDDEIYQALIDISGGPEPDELPELRAAEDARSARRAARKDKLDEAVARVVGTAPKNNSGHG
jgi:phage terminase Nu1 subunit (DNA packaging protein)